MMSDNLTPYLSVQKRTNNDLHIVLRNAFLSESSQDKKSVEIKDLTSVLSSSTGYFGSEGEISAANNDDSRVGSEPVVAIRL